MNKLGYSKIEILVVIVLLGIVAFITINHTSYAFAIDKNEAIEDYALANTTLFEETNTTYISVDDLIEAGYLAGNESGVLTDPTDSSKNFNDKKVKLEYDEKKNNVTATVVD